MTVYQGPPTGYQPPSQPKSQGMAVAALICGIISLVLFCAWYLSVPLGIIVALSLAMLLNTGVRGMAFYRTFFYVPSVVPVVASSMLWIVLTNPQDGALKTPKVENVR